MDISSNWIIITAVFVLVAMVVLLFSGTGVDADNGSDRKYSGTPPRTKEGPLAGTTPGE